MTVALLSARYRKLFFKVDDLDGVEDGRLEEDAASTILTPSKKQKIMNKKEGLGKPKVSIFSITSDEARTPFSSSLSRRHSPESGLDISEFKLKILIDQYILKQ